MILRRFLLLVLSQGTLAMSLADPNVASSFNESTFNNDSVASATSSLQQTAHRHATLQDYLHVRDTACHWIPADTTSFSYFYWPSGEAFGRDYWHNLFSWMVLTSSVSLPRVVRGWMTMMAHSTMTHRRHEQVHSHLCTVRSAAGDSEWRIRRLGPFVGTGGTDWHRVQVQDAFGLANDDHAFTLHSNTAIAAHYLAPVDATTGQVLAFPPVHIHHANLGARHPATNFSRIGEWHGDSQCTDEEGGTDCYMRVLPPTYGYPLLEEGNILDVDADLNDIRASGSDPLMFYLETAVQLVPVTPQKTAGVLILGTPARFHWWDTADFAGTYVVPPGRPSVLWTTAELPVAGTFIASGSHVYTHQDEGWAGAWVIAGATPQELGLQERAYIMQQPWKPWVAQDCTQVLELQALVKVKLQQLQTTCKDQACPRLVWQWNKADMRKGMQMPWPEETWTFAKGEVYTTIVFHEVSKDAPNNHEIRMHFALHASYIPQGEANPEFHYILPSLKPEAAWLDTPNLWMLLTRFGGPPVWNWQTELQVDVIALSLAFVAFLLGALILRLGRCLIGCPRRNKGLPTKYPRYSTVKSVIEVGEIL